MDIITYALCKKAIQKSIETLGDIFTLKGNVSSISELPSSGNEPGDIYLVGPAQDGSYDEYYWTSEGAWEVMGSTKAGFDGAITEDDLYKGEDGTGTIENPAEGTILDIVKDMDSYVAGDNIDISNNVISVLGDTIKRVTASTFNISTAAAGIYQLPQGCTINSDASYTTISTSILIVDSKSGSMVDKAWYLFDGSTGNGRRIVYGYLQGSIGSYVQTTLDQLERNTLKVNSLSSSSTNKQYPSAKCVYDSLELKANNTTFIGTDGTTEGEKGLVPAPTSQDANKYLKSDGTWATVSGGGSSYTAGDYIDITNNEISVDGIVPSENTKVPLQLVAGEYYYTTEDNSEVQLTTETNSGYYKITNDTNNSKDYVFEFSGAVEGENDQYVAFIMDSNNTRVYDDLYYSPITLINTTEEIKYFKKIVFGATLAPGNSFIISCQHTDIYTPEAYLYNFSSSEELVSPGHYDVVASVGYPIEYHESENWNYFVYQNTGIGRVFGFKIKSYCSDSQMYAITDNNEIVIQQSGDAIDWTQTPRMVGVYLNKGDKFFVSSLVSDDSYIPEVIAYTINSVVLDEYTKFTDTFVGTDGISNGRAGIVPAPSLIDTDKFLKSDGTWGTPGGAGYVHKSGDTMTGKLTVPTLSVGDSNTVSEGCVGEGSHVQAMNMYSHAEGWYTHATGKYSHAEGDYSTASGEDAHAEGYTTVAQARYSHAEGNSTDALSQSQHVQGEWNIQDHTGTASTRGTYAHIVGNGTRESARSNAHTLDWSGNAWFAGDVYVGSTSGTDKDNGSKKLATDDTFGGTDGTNAGTKGLVPAPTASDTDKYLKSDGTWATVSGGSGNYVSKTGDTMTGRLIAPSLIVGSGNTIGQGVGDCLVEGWNCAVNELAGHAEGWNCTVGTGSGEAEAAHAEGCQTKANGFTSHSEGYYTEAWGQHSHAEGERTKVESQADNSHVEGYYTTASRTIQHVEGKYNVLDTGGSSGSIGTYVHIVGGGTSTSNRKNIHTLDWSGNGWFQGDVYTGSTSGTNKDSGSKKLATEEYVRNLLQEFATLNNLNMPD